MSLCGADSQSCADGSVFAAMWLAIGPAELEAQHGRLLHLPHSQVT